MQSDLQEWKDRNGGSEPQFPVGAVFGVSEWRDLSRYVFPCAREKRVTIALARGHTITIAVDPKLPPDTIVWYWLESNLEAHLSKLRK